MEEYLKPFLEKLIELIDEKNYWNLSLIVIAVLFSFIGVGMLISWIFNKRKIKSDTEKNNIEIRERALNLVNRIQETRNIYINNVQLMQISIKEAIEAFKTSNLTKLSNAWEEARDFYFNELINSFETYLEQNEILLKNDRNKKLYFIIDEVFPLFEISETFIETLNNKIILQAIGKAPISLKSQTLYPTIRYTKRNLSIFRIKKRIKLYRTIKVFEKYKNA